MSEILEKLRKLKNMIERGTINESANAQRLYETLMKKYSVNAKDIEEPKEFFITIPIKSALSISLILLVFLNLVHILCVV